MSIDFLGIDGPPFIDVQLSISAIALLSAYLLAAIYSMLHSAQQFRKLDLRRSLFLITLVLLAFSLAQVLILRPQTPSPIAVQPRAPAGPGLALLGMVPVLVAAAWLGSGPALLVGLASGLGSAAWDTFRITQPLEVALWAVLLSILLRQRYRGVTGSWLRQPVVTAVLSALLVGWPLTIAGVAAAGPLTGLAGMEYALALVRPTLISFLGEALVAGLILQGLVLALPALRKWHPHELVAPPWKQHLNQRISFTIIPIAVVAIAILAAGVSFVAFRVASDLVINQMARDAAIASNGLPSFLDTGRSLIQNLADDQRLSNQDSGESEQQFALEAALRTVPFFQELIYITPSGDIESVYPARASGNMNLTAAEETLVTHALEISAPAESEVYGLAGEQSAFISFASPIGASSAEEAAGLLVGRALLGDNPFMQPIADVLRGMPMVSDEGFVIDSDNTILLYPAHPERQLEMFELSTAAPTTYNAHDGSTYRTYNVDGSQQIIYVQQIAEYPEWSVVVSVPRQVILGLALQIALPALIIATLLAGLSISIIMAVFRRLSEPLGALAHAADRIASGEADQPVTVEGEDEIGRLGLAFEDMRQKLKVQLDEQETLLEISYAASASLDLQLIIPPILSAAIEATTALGVRIVLRREDGSFQTFASGEAAVGIAPMDEELVEYADLQGALVVSRIERAQATLPSSKQTPHVKALIASPIRSEKQFHGILWLAYDKEHDFEQSEVNFLASLANQASFAVANARLFEAAEGGRRQLAAILSSTDDAVLVSDSKHRLLLLNPAAEKILNVKAEAAIGKDSAQTITQPELVTLLEDTKRASTSEELPQDDGTTLLAHASTIQGNNGKPLGRVVLLSDITYLKELDDLKSTFVSAVSHDLRAPLTFMSGYLTMLPMVGDLNEKQIDFVGKMKLGVEQMGDLIDKLLRLGRLEAGVPLDLEACDVKALVTDCYESIYDRAQKQQVALELEVADDLPHIVADSTLYRQAVMNLIENAVKYTPAGGNVSVSARSNGTEVTIAVKDTGPGISEENQKHLFEPFFRAKGKTAKIKGSGLGLAIVQGTADRHEGRVYLESALDEGSTFFLVLPRRQQEKSSVEQPA